MAKYRTKDTDTPNEVNKILNRHIELIESHASEIAGLKEVVLSLINVVKGIQKQLQPETKGDKK